MNIIEHYDKLIDENNDPVYDPEPLREYMNKWDGQVFVDAMKLDKHKTVLEIGIGTGRLSLKTAPLLQVKTPPSTSPSTTAKTSLCRTTSSKAISSRSKRVNGSKISKKINPKKPSLSMRWLSFWGSSCKNACIFQKVHFMKIVKNASIKIVTSKHMIKISKKMLVRNIF